MVFSPFADFCEGPAVSTAVTGDVGDENVGAGCSDHDGLLMESCAAPITRFRPGPGRIDESSRPSMKLAGLGGPGGCGPTGAESLPVGVIVAQCWDSKTNGKF